MNEQLGCSIADACRMSGIGRTKLYELMSDGEVAHRKIGKRTIVVVSSLRALIEGQR
jgi:hypothetical protein